MKWEQQAWNPLTDYRTTIYVSQLNACVVQFWEELLEVRVFRPFLIF